MMLEHVIEWQTDRNLDKMPYRHGDELTNIVEEVCETLGQPREYASEMVNCMFVVGDEYNSSNEQKVDAYFDICVYAIGAMLKLGYNPIKVFEEGLKEINDRTGAYDAQVGKWVKGDKNPNAYKADYSKARI